MRFRRGREVSALVFAAIVWAQASAVPPVGAGAGARASAPADWSRAVVDSTIKRYPTAESLKGWGYAKSLYLYGVYLVYLRTKDRRYLEHLQSWIDLHIDDKGTINRPI